MDGVGDDHGRPGPGPGLQVAREGGQLEAVFLAALERGVVGHQDGNPEVGAQAVAHEVVGPDELGHLVAERLPDAIAGRLAVGQEEDVVEADLLAERAFHERCVGAGEVERHLVGQVLVGGDPHDQGHVAPLSGLAGLVAPGRHVLARSGVGCRVRTRWGSALAGCNARRASVVVVTAEALACGSPSRHSSP